MLDLKSDRCSVDPNLKGSKLHHWRTSCHIYVEKQNKEETVAPLHVTLIRGQRIYKMTIKRKYGMEAGRGDSWELLCTRHLFEGACYKMNAPDGGIHGMYS